MTLNVDIKGYGIVATSSQGPYSVYIINIQQETHQGWMIYRKYQSFHSLYEHLKENHLISNKNILLSLPFCDIHNHQKQYLELNANHLNQWLKEITSHQMILQTQYMYQFLCMDANLPPPYLEIFWREQVGSCGNRVTNTSEDVIDNYLSDDEMDMDELFEKGSTSSYGSGSGSGSGSSGTHSTYQSNHIHYPDNHNMQYHDIGIRHSDIPTKRNLEDIHDTEDDEDGMDIQSISVVEAEFLYDKKDISNSMKSPRSCANLVAKSLIDSTSSKRKINLDSFHIIKVIGKGSFGKVFLVREKASSTLYALKILRKDYIIKKNQVEHTRTERSVLGYIHHPFIVGLNMAFQTNDKLFFVLDYCAGGELFFHLGKVGRFSEERSKFYASQIILALEHIHSYDIIYRDLKPENVLLDHTGNVRLTDFGLSKEGVSSHSTGAYSFCGTPEYIAPEVLLRQGHGRAVDWWSLGALLYEMISGLPPFYSRNRETMFQKIMNAELAFPPFMTEQARDILSKLLVRDPTLRLGSGERDGIEVKENIFLRDVDWNGLLTGHISPPWVPTVVGSLDTSQFDQEFTSMAPTVSPDVREAYFGSVDRTFEGFSFVDEKAGKFMSQNYNQTHTGVGSYKGSGMGIAMLSSSVQQSHHRLK